jgi:hypothetical protein
MCRLGRVLPTCRLQCVTIDYSCALTLDLTGARQACAGSARMHLCGSVEGMLAVVPLTLEPP